MFPISKLLINIDKTSESSGNPITLTIIKLVSCSSFLLFVIGLALNIL